IAERVTVCPLTFTLSPALTVFPPTVAFPPSTWNETPPPFSVIGDDFAFSDAPASTATCTPPVPSVMPFSAPLASMRASPPASSAERLLSSLRNTCAMVFSERSITFPSLNHIVASESVDVWIVSPLYTGEFWRRRSQTTRSRNLRCAVLYLNVIVAIGDSLRRENAWKKLL